MRARTRFHLMVIISCVTAAALNPAARANGYFAHGYGTANKGLGGAGVALPQDSLSVATNPAGLAFLDQRYDAGLALFNPSSSYTVDSAPTGFPGTLGLAAGSVDNDSDLVVIPHFGFSRKLGGRSRWGLAIYGHGGMSSEYPTNTFFASSPTGLELSQLFLAPSYAIQSGRGSSGSGRHGFGVSLIVAYQSLEIQGMQLFGLFSSDPANLSDNGSEESLGFGLKLGYLGRFGERFSFGVSYQSEIGMEELDAYAGFLADQGGFDIPATWTAGVAVAATDRLTFVLDLQQTLYSDIPALGNPLLPNLFQAPLGSSGGAGFGWDDTTTVKAGVQIAGGGDWTWRFGVAVGDSPIPSSEVLFNILTPVVAEERLTAGFTKTLSSGRAFNLALMFAPSTSLSGTNSLAAPFPNPQGIELEMDQLELEISYSWGI